MATKNARRARSEPNAGTVRNAARSGKATTGSVRTAPAISAKQMRLPAGYHAGRARKASLKEVLDPEVETVDGDKLDAGQRARLTLARIAAQRSFNFHTLGGPLLSKRRALREVRAGTPLGDALVDIEHRAIRLMREYAAAKRRSHQKTSEATRRRARTSQPKKGKRR
jgi:hypothetical protein